MSRHLPTPKAGHGPWLVAVAALLLALAALVVVLSRGAGETRYVDVGREHATVLAGMDCIDGVAVARGGVRADGAGRLDLDLDLDLDETTVGGTFDELDGRVDPIQTTGLAHARCRVELLDSTEDCASSLTAPRVVTVAAGPTRYGYGETGAGTILAPTATATATATGTGAGAGAGAGGVQSELRLVDVAAQRRRIRIGGPIDLLLQACLSTGALQPVGVIDTGSTSAARTSASARDVVLIGALVLVLAGVVATMGRRRLR